MVKKLSPYFFVFSMMLFADKTSAQLFVDGATFTIETGAVVTVQGDVTSNVDILGGGKLLLKGSTSQNLNMNSFSVPNLELDNVQNANLTGNTRIGSTLTFTNGKLILGGNDLTLSSTAVVSGQGTNKFAETNGTGQVFKEISANLVSAEIPVGEGTAYRPAFVTTTGTYSSAKVGVRVATTGNSNRPPKVSDFVAPYWSVSRTGITGTASVAGQYVDTDITGTESNIRGYYYNGTDWSSASGTNDAALNRVGAPVTGTGGIIAGINKFILMGSRAFLQGAYTTSGASPSSSTGLMTQSLRTQSLIPSSDPYRTATYSTVFPHVNNSPAESVIGTPFASVGGDANSPNNIVDWVFLELRNSTSTAVQQTRSALLQRDGDIVDVDGSSPVTFNNLPDGNYSLTVRHRNHLWISQKSTTPSSLGEAQSTAFTDLNKVIDLRVAPLSKLSGSSTATSPNYTTASHPTLGTVNLMIAGNANDDAVVKMTGFSLSNNDYSKLLNTLGSSANTINAVYSKQDLNMDGKVNMLGFSPNTNDYSKLLNSLGSSAKTATQSTIQ